MPPGSRPSPPVGTARVAISTQGSAGPEAVNVIWLNLTASTHVQADLDALLDAIAAAWHTRFTSFIDSAKTVVEIRASWIFASGSVLESVRARSDAMTGGTGVDNLATCYVIDWAIGDYYRGGHPRTYLPGPPQSVITDGRTVSATPRANLAAAAVNFKNDVNALTQGGISAVALGTVSFARGKVWRTPPLFRPYLGASVRQVIGTQRRRLGGM